MYSIPLAKNGVYFTKNLTEANYTKGTELLGWLWRASKMPSAGPFVSFNGMLNYLSTNYPTYIEWLGTLSEDTDRNKLVDAMKEAGKLTGTAYPRPSLINNALAIYQVKSNSEILKETGIEVAGDISRYARYALYGTIALLFIYAGSISFGRSKSGKNLLKSFENGIKKLGDGVKKAVA